MVLVSHNSQTQRTYTNISQKKKKKKHKHEEHTPKKLIRIKSSKLNPTDYMWAILWFLNHNNSPEIAPPNITLI